MTHPKILCIALPKSGTSSIHAALVGIGFRSLHNAEKSHELVRRVTCGQEMPAWWNSVDAVSDGPLYKIAPQMLQRFDKLQLLIVRRELRSWMNSWMIHILHNRAHPRPDGRPSGAQHIDTRRLEREHAAATAIYDQLAGHPRVLEFRLSDGWGPLCRFLGRGVPNIPFPHENTSVDKLDRIRAQYSLRADAVRTTPDRSAPEEPASSGDPYDDFVLPHARSATHRGDPSEFSFAATARNMSCGDEVRLGVSVEYAGTIEAAGFSSKGCVISRAAASILCEWLTGKSKQSAMALTATDMLKLMRVPLLPRRRRCALLAWEAFQGILANTHNGSGFALSPPTSHDQLVENESV